MFHYDGGLKLTQAGLAIDVRRRQPRAFVSHAHADHMARHQLALCTPATGRLYRFRLGSQREVLELPYQQPVEWGGLRLTTYPAGHCLGSAMLLAEDAHGSLLYTGDFKLGPSATSEQAILPPADILVIESTYGDPRYRLMPRQQAIEQLIEQLHEVLRDGATPVIHAYVLGKAQEVTRIVSEAGFPVLQHEAVFEISQIYQACGVDLGNYALYPGYARPGHVVVAPPRQQRRIRPLAKLGRTVTFAVSGWAHDPASRHRLGVDRAVPLSDHADYDELLEAIERVAPREIYCTHGPGTFVDRLRHLGLSAYPLDGRAQRLLF